MAEENGNEVVAEVSARDRIRALTVGHKKVFRTKLYVHKVETENGTEEITVEFREPTRRLRSNLLKKATDKKGNISNDRFVLLCLVHMTYVPGTNELVFEETDIDGLFETPSGTSFVETFASEMANLINPNIQVTEKNLEETPSEELF